MKRERTGSLGFKERALFKETTKKETSIKQPAVDTMA